MMIITDKHERLKYAAFVSIERFRFYASERRQLASDRKLLYIHFIAGMEPDGEMPASYMLSIETGFNDRKIWKILDELEVLGFIFRDKRNVYFIKE